VWFDLDPVPPVAALAATSGARNVRPVGPPARGTPDRAVAPTGIAS
jgi:hypothetical protein